MGFDLKFQSTCFLSAYYVLGKKGIPKHPAKGLSCSCREISTLVIHSSWDSLSACFAFFCCNRWHKFFLCLTTFASLFYLRFMVLLKLMTLLGILSGSPTLNSLVSLCVCVSLQIPEIRNLIGCAQAFEPGVLIGPQ